ncbi:hypothetical protein SAMN04488550_0590 [Gordonia malaquae]|uniref:Uncharacterized protein n=1 Tax=Gordonia malaquae NBRC 108250 TaxID=1223542 RepID=M3VBU0_GORML|nr:hypothetical protein [Gordonia malaquae]GAC80848.1 hypothetical protein GM1_023_00070 [Gordonia malaquae NBRC 108250]SEB67079.1 hypothetical protein SAMN04488550_0590 [Gordonia malaquae]
MTGMTETDTAAQRRQQEEREQRTADIRRLLDQGGSEEVAKKYGKSELASSEYKAAQRQRQAAQARRREAAEARARDGRERDQGQKPRTRQEMVDAQRSFERSGAKAQGRGRERVQSQGQAM